MLFEFRSVERVESVHVLNMLYSSRLPRGDSRPLSSAMVGNRNNAEEKFRDQGPEVDSSARTAPSIVCIRNCNVGAPSRSRTTACCASCICITRQSSVICLSCTLREHCIVLSCIVFRRAIFFLCRLVFYRRMSKCQ